MNPPTFFTSAQMLPFVYLVTSTAMVASGTNTQTLTLGVDSDFELLGFTAWSSLDVATEFLPNHFKVEIIESSTGRQLTSGQVPQAVFMGNSFNFLYEYRPVRFPRQDQFTLNFTNLSAASACTVFLGFKGYKIFPVAQ